MNGASHLRGMTDVRTSVSTHGPVRPRRQESVHLQLFRLEKERQRLEVEMQLLRKRVGRVGARMAEIDELTGGRSGPPARDAAAGWRRMTVGY